MSLINDVLRDLERRGETDVPRALPRAEAPRGRRHHWVWWVLAATLAGVLLHWRLGGTPPATPPDSARLAATDTVDRAPEPAAGPAPAVLSVMPREAKAAESATPSAVAREDRPEPPESGPVAQPREEPEPAVPEPSRDEPANEASEAALAASVGEPGPAEAAPPAVERVAQAPREATDKPGRQTGAGAAPANDGIVIQRSGAGPEHSEDGLAAAKRALGRGQRALATSRLERLVEDAPGNTEARLLLARLHIEDGRPRKAGELLKAGLEETPAASGIALLWGRLLLDQGQVAMARTVLTEHAPPVAAEPDYHLLLAMAHRQAGESEAAIRTYRHIAETSPGVGAAWVGLGVSLETKGDIEGARSAYRNALGGNDRRAAAYARQRLAVMPAAPTAEEH